ncbi:hypothetical protein NDA11_005416 [Ustilago hordei]|uniref:Uncharacterized protein n=1 Tax=Ustilago hordei TaxID=120017 RepID=I2FQL6_USTHO|nr:hypothetical protein NDA10_004083 [Ustilago hordei]KAJ1596108.1 hypothetical protein NDA11_005416 [Ustilago hordei]CCF49209.1 uncharacterized protein UHOR_13591 [Ustilago hordei]
MAPSPYQTRSKTTVTAPPPEVATTSSRCCWVILQVQPCRDTTAGTNPPAPPVLARVADPLASLVARSPLEPLFLGMDGNDVTPSPLPSPFLACTISPPHGE